MNITDSSVLFSTEQLREDMAEYLVRHALGNPSADSALSSSSSSSSASTSSLSALRIFSSKGAWLRVHNALVALNGVHLNTYSLAFRFRLTKRLPASTACLLFHPDPSSPEMLSTSLLIDDAGDIYVGEQKLANAPKVLGPQPSRSVPDGLDEADPDWHHLAVVVSLARAPEHSDYRVYLDGKLIGAVQHSAIVDLSAVRISFFLSIFQTQTQD